MGLLSHRNEVFYFYVIFSSINIIILNYILYRLSRLRKNLSWSWLLENTIPFFWGRKFENNEEIRNYKYKGKLVWTTIFVSFLIFAVYYIISTMISN